MIYNDKVAPVVLELAKQGHKVDTVTIGAYPHEYVARCGYSKWFKQLTRIRPLISTDHPSLLDKFLLRIRYIILLLEMRLRGGYIAFFDTKPPAPMFTRLGNVAKKRGCSIGFPANYIDTWQGEINWDKIRKDPVVSKRLGKLPEPIPYKLDHLSAAMIYNSDLINFNPGFTDQKRIIVPHPKLQSWWGEFLKEYPPQYNDEQLQTLDSFIAVFLTHQGNYFLREDSDLNVLVPEIVNCVQAVFPNMPIVVKPKDTIFKKQKEWFRQLIKEIDDPNLIVTDAPVSVLAHKAIAGITTGHTTAQFEFVGTSAPWIEYTRYSDFWKAIYLKSTYTPDYGGIWVKTPEELCESLQQIKEGNLHTDQERLKTEIQFFDQPISFHTFYDRCQ